MKRYVWQSSLSLSWLSQSSYSGSNSISYPLPFLVQDMMHCFLSDPVFECEWATNVFRWELVDRWIRYGSFSHLNELREGKHFDSGRNGLDERLEAYLICVWDCHMWISLFIEFWLYQSEAVCSMWKIWSRDIKLMIQQMWTRFALETILSQTRENQSFDSVYSSEFFAGRWSARYR